jgi:hypothetical protein
MKKQLQKITLFSALFLSVGISAFGQVLNCNISATNYAFCLGDSTTLSINNVSNSCGNMAGSLQNGLVGWWPFCGNANDESGNGNNGTVNGATLTADRFGNNNNAYSFDGVDDYIDIDINSSLPNGLTLSAWINTSLPNSEFGHKGIVWSRLSGPSGNPPFAPNQATGIMINPDGLLCAASDGNSIVQLQENGQFYNDTTWNHLVFSMDINTGNSKIFVNGIETSSSISLNLSLIDLAYTTIKIGKDEIIGYGNRHWNGLIDDIGIWNRALTQQEIEQLYNQGNLSTWWSDGTTNQTSIQVQPTQTTTYSVTVSDGVGSCTDSITIQVNNPQINAGSDISVCEGDSTTLTATGASKYAWDNGVVNGQSFVPTVEGYYNVTGTDTLGCSNSVSIFVDLLQPTTSNLERIACDMYTAPDGNVYTNSGQYLAIIPNTVGCDSTIQLSLTINNSSSSAQTTTELDSYTWPVNGQTYTQSGVYTAVIPNSKGCDSTITLNLSLQFTGISEINGKEIVITPNPVDASFTLIADSKYIGSEYILTNQQGAIVAKGTIRATKMEVNCSYLAKGTYLFQLNASDHHVIRVLKN